MPRYYCDTCKSQMGIGDTLCLKHRTQFKWCECVKQAIKALGSTKGPVQTNIHTFFKSKTQSNKVCNDQHNPIRIGTDFSGSEMPILAMRHSGVNFRHVFAAEKDNYVREFIRKSYNPEDLYADVRDRPCALIINWISSSRECRVQISHQRERVWDNMAKREGCWTTLYSMLKLPGRRCLS